MHPLALNALALALLLAVSATLSRWFARSLAEVPLLARLCLLLSTAGGLLGAPFWWSAAPASFAWTLAPLAFRFLAVAGLTFGVVGLSVMARPQPARLRLVLRMLALYLLPLVVALLGLHRQRLDWSAPIAWGFVAIAGGLALGAVLALARMPAVTPETPPGRGLLWTLAAVVFGLWGLGLFLTPEGPNAALWLWPQDALTSQLIGAMLLTLALMAAEARARASLQPLVALGFASYGLGIALACALHALDGRPLPLAYLLALGLAGLLGASRLR